MTGFRAVIFLACRVLLKPVETVINGVPFGRPHQSPFAVR